MSAVSERCTILETPLEFAIETHPKLEKSILRSAYRGLFYSIYKTDDAKSLHKAIKRSVGHSFFDKLMRKLSKLR